MIPLEVVVRNYAAGSFSKRLAIEEGTKLVTPIIEFITKKIVWMILLLTKTIFISKSSHSC